jgi:serine/threonine protein kinase
LVQWQEDRLSPAQVQDLLLHLESCVICQQTVDGLAAADPISRHLRHEPPAFSEAEIVEVKSTVERLQSQRPASTSAKRKRPASAGETKSPFLSSAEAADELGRLGPYRIQGLLGQGEFGLVFQAEDLQSKRPVALKVLRPETGHERQGEQQARQNFLRAARAAAAVRHDHVVPISHVGDSNDVPYLVMELLRGQSLETRYQNGPPLSFREVVRIGREVAEGLAAVHTQGLTHCNLTPSNIWLEAPHDTVKLLDIGLARAVEADSLLARTDLLKGMPFYLAPEQAQGTSVDARTDLFSLGCVLFRLVARRPPFPGKHALAILYALATQTPPALCQLDPEIPATFSQLVASLLARRPEDRPASAQAVVKALRVIERAEITSTAEANSSSAEAEPQRHRVGRHRWRAVAAWLLLLAVVTGAVLVLRYWK